LVTGASTGIGNEFSRLLAQDGYNLVLIARNEEKLKKLSTELEEKYNIFAKVIVKDLSFPNSPLEIFKETKEQELNISVLINNAGYGSFGEFFDSKIENEINMLQVNVLSLTYLTYLYGREMIKLGGGKILNVASTAAFQPGPLMAVYYASKAYVLHFSEALSNELGNKGIIVTTLCPGPTRTNFQERADMEESKLINGRQIMDAAFVAYEGYKGMKAGRTLVIPGIQNKVMSFGVKFLPRRIVTKLVRSIQESRQ
jgi:short-subunit dehydrogenase